MNQHSTQSFPGFISLSNVTLNLRRISQKLFFDTILYTDQQKVEQTISHPQRIINKISAWAIKKHLRARVANALYQRTLVPEVLSLLMIELLK